MNSGLPASECGPGYYYGKGIGNGQRGSQSYEWTLWISTGDWVHRRLLVGGLQSLQFLELGVDYPLRSHLQETHWEGLSPPKISTMTLGRLL